MTWITVVALFVAGPGTGVAPYRVALFGGDVRKDSISESTMASIRKSALDDCHGLAESYRREHFEATCRELK